MGERSRTISGSFDSRRNSLNALRLLLAAAVIVSHSWPIGGFGREPALAGRTLGLWAVLGFFGISGYLIAQSRGRTLLAEFLFRRVLRIYPGFLVCLLVVSFVFAPLSVLAGSGSYEVRDAIAYVLRNMFLKVEQDGIAHTLEGVPFASAWNGSLWTLFYEFACYVAIGLLMLAPRRWHGPLAALGFVATSIGDVYAASHAINVSVAHFFTLSPVFFAGSLLYFYRDKVPLLRSLGLASLVLSPVAMEFEGTRCVAAGLIAYLCLWMGKALPLSKVGRENDISYGVYIYAFPVQQMLSLLELQRFGVWVFVAASVAGTLPFACASWFGIERRALALKDRWSVWSSLVTGPGLRKGPADRRPSEAMVAVVAAGQPSQGEPQERAGEAQAEGDQRPG